MPNRNLLMILLLVIGLVIIPTGCKKKPAETTPPPADTEAAGQADTPADRVDTPPEGVEVTEGFQQERPTVEEEIEPTVAQWNEMGALKTIYFAFDKSDLSDEARRTLRANADWMKAHDSYVVAVQGHCDERGTIEYNLALGQRRAQAVKDYLGSLAVSGSQLRTVTYGEERPLASGHDESSWAQNRRAEFVIE